MAPAVTPVFVLSGSLSPVTATQTANARAYVRLGLDAARLARQDAGYVEATRSEIAAHLGAGRHVLAFTAPTNGAAVTPELRSAALARACGDLLRAVLDTVALKRVGVAGGDTSSYALGALDAWGMQYAGALSPGVPLCRIRSNAPHMDGLEIMLKGGQMGPPDLFDTLVRGEAA